MDKLFDLNIEKVLEHWGVEHAIREIIANALDEQQLTNTKDIDISYSDGVCHIRDYGRGLKYMHFTQNENSEKLAATNLIGKFGVGLKDALGVFYRHGIEVIIHSKYSSITLTMNAKTGFNVETLHAVFSEPEYADICGTDFVLKGIKEADLQKAKEMFLVFNSNVELLEKNNYGEVYRNKTSDDAVIYANGVQIAKESNFMFTYNITSMNAQMKKALNRERSNVGRTAYSDTVKNILKNCKSDKVLRALVSDISNCMRGTNKDETGWVDIAAYAAQTMNRLGGVVFMTPTERASLTNQQVEILKESGKELIMVNDAVFGKIAGNVATFSTVAEEYVEKFRYEFVDYKSLSDSERKVFDESKAIVDLLCKKFKRNTPIIKISKTIRIDMSGFATSGVWDADENAIIIKRSVLKSKEDFCGVLMHEFAHFASGYSDNTRDFENVLTDMLGYVYVTLQPKATESDVPIKKRRFFFF
ncbi:MAG: ATP-binding protein [Clostridia bacterium]|nr:ATP-binding protein [Clostridia bacterium]